jgi:thiamine biosynthesis lipoprotein
VKLHRITKKITGIKGIGTLWSFEFFEEVDDEIELKILLQEIISDFEKKYSRFHEKSLIYKLNNDKFVENNDEEFRSIISTGIQLYKQTDGVFNFMTGRIIEDKGYDRKYSFISKENDGVIEDPEKALRITDESIYLSQISKIDIGGFGKGFLIEKIALNLIGMGYQYFLINGGGDIKVTSDNGNPVVILLQHPAKREYTLGTLKLKDLSLASSSPMIRQWKDPNSKRVKSHLINTKDLNNESHNSAFVISPNTIYADAYSTTMSIDMYTKFKDPYPFEYLVIKNEKLKFSRAFKSLLKD